MKELNFYIFLGSSAVERSTVNRLVAGSNPARGVLKSRKVMQSHLPGDFFFAYDCLLFLMENVYTNNDILVQFYLSFYSSFSKNIRPDF